MTPCIWRGPTSPVQISGSSAMALDGTLRNVLRNESREMRAAKMRATTMRTLLALLLAAPAAYSQVDFTGEWAPAYHEDAPERGPGPELGDYLGIPLNDAGRLRADSYDADRISVVT